MTTTLPTTPAEAIHKAAELISERGLAKERLEDSEGRLCTSGALQAVISGYKSYSAYLRSNGLTMTRERSRLFSDTKKELRQGLGISSIPRWNDADERNTENTAAALHAIADTLA